MGRIDGNNGIHRRSNDAGGAGFAEPQRVFSPALIGHVPEDDNDAAGLPPVVFDRSRAFFHREAFPGFADKDGGSSAPRLIRFERRLEHLCQLPSHGFFVCPAGQLFGNGIHEGDCPARIRRDDRIADAAQRGGEPSLALPQPGFHPVLVERHLDRDREFTLLERLEDVPKGIGHLGPLQRAVVGIGREIHNGEAVQIPDPVRSSDPVDVALEHDIHEDKVRTVPSGFLYGFTGGGGDRDNLVPAPRQPAGNVFRNDMFIFNDQNRRLAH